jgi:hypothetical protein
VQIINDHKLLAGTSEWITAVEQLHAAQELIHGVGNAINREIARTALGSAS